MFLHFFYSLVNMFAIFFKIRGNKSKKIGLNGFKVVCLYYIFRGDERGKWF